MGVSKRFAKVSPESADGRDPMDCERCANEEDWSFRRAYQFRESSAERLVFMGLAMHLRVGSRGLAEKTLKREGGEAERFLM
jgi:hypothetical protein